MDVERAMESLNESRDKIEKLKSDKIRLVTNLETHEKTREELDEKCREKFDVDIEGLGDKIGELSKKAEVSLSEVKQLLGE